jgi:exodeoxyribonuclease III
MKLISFNVNGIRSALNKGFKDWFIEQNPDIMCLQEIKLSETELVEPLFTELGYHCYWHPAKKRGYSGVAILSKTAPEHISFGMNIEKYDNEGRVLVADYKDFSVICVYFPSGTSGDERQEVKISFLEDFYAFVNLKLADSKKLLICGDVNICHNDIDIHNPRSNARTSGFLPEERAWVSRFIEIGMIDTFRHFNKEPHQYSWWSYRAAARAKNLGWRIDYFFCSTQMSDLLAGAKIHSDVIMSDHCPVSLQLKL